MSVSINTSVSGGFGSGSSSALSELTLGSGDTAITHTHANRPLIINQAGATTGTFGNAAAGSLVAGDSFFIRNTGAGTWTAQGNITAPTGMKLTAGPGETFTADYDSVDDAWYSSSLSTTAAAAIIAGREPFFCSVPRAGLAVNDSLGINPQVVDSSTLGALAYAATNLFTHVQKTKYTAAATAVNRQAGWNISNATGILIAPTVTIVHGWKVRFLGGIGEALTGGTFGIGIGRNWLATAQPSTSLDALMFGGDTTDTNMQFMVNDGSGACDKTDLGANFPNHTNSLDFYEFTIEFRSTGAARTVTLTARNLRNGATATLTPSSNLPAEGTLLGIQMIRGSAADTAAAAIFVNGGCYAGPLA